MQGWPVFLKDQNFYFKLIEINANQFLAGIDEEIKIWSENLKQIVNQKDKNI